MFAPAVAKVYIVTFRTHDDRRPSNFIVLADCSKDAIDMACKVGLEHIKPPPKSLNEILAQVGKEGANGNGVVGIMEIQISNRDSTGQSQEMKEGADENGGVRHTKPFFACAELV